MIKIVQDPANRNVYVRLDNITRDTLRGIRLAYYKIGKDLKDLAIKKIMEGPKTGIWYIYRREKVSKKYFLLKTKKGEVTYSKAQYIHQASAPGEYPANWSGALKNSINFLVRGSEQLEFGAATKYARRLELGDKDGQKGGKIEARPYLLPSVDNTKDKAVEHFETEIKRALNGERI